MKKLLLNLVTLFVLSSLSAQQPYTIWADKMGGNNNEVSNSIVSDGTGNIYTTGYFKGVTDFDPGVGVTTLTATGTQDVFIKKVDANGALVWVKQLSGNATGEGLGIDLDASGSVIVTGYFTGTVDFNPGTATLYKASQGGEDVFIVRLNSSGTFLWANNYGSAGNDRGNGIVSDDLNGQIYTTGFVSSAGSFDIGAIGIFAPLSNVTPNASSARSMFMFRINANGVFNYTTTTIPYSFIRITTGTGTSEGKAIALNGADLNITGVVTGVVDFDPSNNTTNLSTLSSPVTSGFLYSFNTSGFGVFNWVREFQVSTSSCRILPTSIKVDNSGNIYTAGTFSTAMDIDANGPAPALNSNGGYDMFLSKHNQSGTFAWVKQMGGTGDDGIRGLTVDPSNNPIVIGTFNNTVDFDPNAGIANLTSNGGYDYFISKYDLAGNYVWSRSTGGTLDDVGNSITNINSGNTFFATGVFQNTTNFGFGLPNYSLTASGGADIFVHRIDLCYAPPAPIDVSVATNTNVCAGINPVFTASSSATVNWYSTNTSTTVLNTGLSYTPAGLAAGTYTFYASANTCTNSTRTPFVAIIRALPNVTVNSGAACVGQIFTLTPSGSATSYTFNNGSGPSTGASLIVPIANTSYTVTGQGANGCFNTTVSNLSISPTPTLTTSSATICAGANGFITVAGAATYTWSTGSNFSSIIASPAVTTVYTVTGKSAFGCISAPKTATIVVGSAPVVVVNSTSVCVGNTATLTASGVTSYTWSTGSNASSIVVTPSVSTTYTVNGFLSGCAVGATNTGTVSVVPIPTISVNSGAICSGNSFTISPSGASTYSVIGNPSLVVSPTLTTAYTIIGSSAAGCISSNLAISTVSVNISPIISVNNGTICSGNSFTIVPSGASTYTYSSGSNVVTPLSNTAYSIIGTDAIGCVSSNTAISNVVVNSLPNINITSSDSILCSGSAAILTASGANTYIWNTTATTSTLAVSPIATANYSVTGTDGNGCVNTDYFTQLVSICSGIREIAGENIIVNMYPNPTNGILNIKMETLNEPINIEITNVVGQVVMQETIATQQTSLNISNLINGIYFVKITEKNKLIGTQKIIKQ
jgi:hypothetical protein